MVEKKKPSDFTEHPFSSVTQNCESEIVARNIMTILERTGDTFRELTEAEYIDERKEDGSFTDGEMSFFRKVIKYFKSADTAKLFAKAWEDEPDDPTGS